MNSAILALEDGTVFEGRSFGAPAERSGEVVFNTAITGYQEIFTDPSYSGQIVVLTNPQIGNYGTSTLRQRSRASRTSKAWSSASFRRITSNWRSDEDAEHFLADTGIPVISDLDTRALVRHLRTRGVMRGVLSAIENDRREAGREGARHSLHGRPRSRQPRLHRRTLTNGPSRSSRARPPNWSRAAAEPRFHVVAYDFGIKRNILRRLVHVGCRVTVVPALTSAEDVLALKPDGVFLSNGPGDPEPLEHAGRQRPQADRQDADLRHLPRPSDPGPRARRQDLQAEVRTSRRESSGAEPSSPARSRSRRTITASRSIPIR